MNARVRHRLQRSLVYLGLAYDENEPRPVRRQRDRFALLFAPVLFVVIVSDDRGPELAGVVAALFLPSLVIATRVGPLRRLDDRFARTEDPFFVLGLFFAAALLIFPERAGALPAATFACGVTAMLLAAGGRRTRRRPPRPREI